MAEQRKPQLTWQQKLEQGLPLNTLDEVKADADYNYRKRLRDEEDKKAFEALKNRGAQASVAASQAANEESQAGDKKGNK